MEQIIKIPKIIDVIYNAKNFEFKCDNGTHSVNTEILHWIMITLAEDFENLERLIFCPYIPHHGKTDLDRFFSWLAQHLKVKEGKMRVQNISILIEALEEGIASKNRR